MVQTKAGELLVHVDVSPSEQAHKNDSTVICLVGLVSDNPEGLVGLQQYKKTRSKKNSIAKKARVAKTITDAIKKGELRVHGVLCLAHGSEWYRYGTELLESIPGVDLTDESKGIQIGNQTIPRPAALAMASYSTGLSIIALRASIWAQNLGLNRIVLLLDKLPNKDVADPFELLKVINSHSDLKPVWDDMRETFGVSFQLADEWMYRSPGESDNSGKDHPNAILTDWIAQSAYAAANSEEWLKKSTKATEDARRAVVGPYLELHEQGLLKTVSLERLTSEAAAAERSKQTGDSSVVDLATTNEAGDS